MQSFYLYSIFQGLKWTLRCCLLADWERYSSPVRFIFFATNEVKSSFKLMGRTLTLVDPITSHLSEHYPAESLSFLFFLQFGLCLACPQQVPEGERVKVHVSLMPPQNKAGRVGFSSLACPYEASRACQGRGQVGKHFLPLFFFLPGRIRYVYKLHWCHAGWPSELWNDLLIPEMCMCVR